MNQAAGIDEGDTFIIFCYRLEIDCTEFTLSLQKVYLITT